MTSNNLGLAGELGSVTWDKFDFDGADFLGNKFELLPKHHKKLNRLAVAVRFALIRMLIFLRSGYHYLILRQKGAVSIPK